MKRMQDLIDRARTMGPIRLAVVGAGHGLVLDGLQRARSLGLAEPCLIGDAREIADLAKKHGWNSEAVCIAAVDSDSDAATSGARLFSEGRVDAIMKGHIHTDVFMRADMVEQTWRIVQPVLDVWVKHDAADLPIYPAGSSGPGEADALWARGGRRWRSLNGDDGGRPS